MSHSKSLSLFGLSIAITFGYFLHIKKKTKTKNICDILIERNCLAYDMEYKGIFTNHMIHWLWALKQMGASESVLEEDYILYAQGEISGLGALEKRIPDGGRVREDNLMQFLGERRYFEDYVQFFMGKIEEKGIEGAVNEYFPRVMSGIAGAATHAIVHIGWTLMTRNKMAIAQGLAYPYYCYLSLGEIPVERDRELDPLSIVLEIGNDSTFDDVVLPSFQNTLIRLSTEYSKEITYYASLWDTSSLSVKEHLDQVTMLAITAFFQSGSREFFLLHGVTAIYGIRFVLDCLDEEDQKKLLDYYFLLLLAVYIARKRPSLERKPFDTQNNIFKSWEDINIIAVHCIPDEHKVKLAYACQEMASIYPDHHDLFFNAASENLLSLHTPEWPKILKQNKQDKN